MKLEKKISRNEAMLVKIKTERYFSITGMIGDKSRSDDKVMIAGEMYNYTGGCLHTEIAEHFPELEKFIPLHLSDMDGVPMYAFQNATHWLKEREPKILAGHLRITDAEAEAICSKDNLMDDAMIMIADTIKKMKPVWKKQAEEFLSFIENYKPV